jgi:hypothetical protein
MRPIVEFIEPDWLQDASGEAVFNERQGTVGGTTRHCFSPDPAGPARVEDSPYIR